MSTKLITALVFFAGLLSGLGIGWTTARPSSGPRYEVRDVAGWPARIDKRDGTIEFLQAKR